MLNSEDWTSFFSTTAQIDITAFAILFAIFQIRPTGWRTKPLKAISVMVTLAELLVPLVVALVFLIAHHPWRLACWLSGILGLSFVVYYWIQYAKTNKNDRDNYDKTEVKGLGLSFVFYGAIAAMGFTSPAVGLVVVAAISTWLVLSAAVQSWRLLSQGVFN